MFEEWSDRRTLRVSSRRTSVTLLHQDIGEIMRDLGGDTSSSLRVSISTRLVVIWRRRHPSTGDAIICSVRGIGR